jgi:hypothetical protein
VRLELLPAGRVTGLLAWPDRTAKPATVTMRLTPPLKPRSWLARTREDLLACPLTGGRWICIVPASADLDLELKLDGFAPHYVRGVRVAPGEKHDAGVQRLFQGASLAGWIVDGLGGMAQVRGRVEAIATPRMSDKDQLAKVVESDGYGFFQLGPLDPGVHQIRALADVRVSLRTPVKVELGKETKLPTPLAVRPTATLGVNVSPREDPDAKRWKVRLVGVRGPRTATIEADEIVGVDGRWMKEKLPSGPYVLTIHRADGSTWYREQFELEPPGREVDVVPGQLRVTGSIHIGDEPLATDLAIREQTTGLEVELKSGPNGSFEGWLPRFDIASARWSLRLRERASFLKMSYEGMVPDLATSDEVHFAIKIPSNAIEGTVTDEKGLPQQASVLAQSLEAGNADALRSLLPAQTVSDPEKGRFAIRGLPPGKYGVYALVPTDDVGASIQSETAMITIEAEHGATERASLVFRRTDGIVGRVRTLDGASVQDATVFALATETPYMPMPMVRTDADGFFVTSVPKTASSVDVLVEAVGVGRRATRQQVASGEPLDVRLDPESNGTLIVVSDGRSASRKVLVYHEGVSDSWDNLARWGRWNGSVGGTDELRVPLMAPGTYRACTSGSMRDSIDASADKLPDRCVEGYLPPAGELRLIVPTPKN